MAKVLVLFHSRGGATAALADAIAEGARSVRFTEVDVRRLADLADLAPAPAADAPPAWHAHRALGGVAELAEYDALVLGAPTRHGVMAAELAHLLDALGPLGAKGALADKVGAAFTSGPAHAGHERTLQAVMTAMGGFGMVIAPPGYTDPAMHRGGSPHGATATTGDGAGPTTDDLAAARHQGARVARIAGWVRHAKGHEAGHSHGHSHSHSHSHEGGHHHRH